VESVKISAGEKPRYLPFGPQNTQTTSTAIVQPSTPIYKENVWSSVQAIQTGTGTQSATIQLQGSNEDLSGIGTGGVSCTLNGTTTVTTAGQLFNSLGVLAGMLVLGTGISANTTVASVAASGNSLTLSQTATLTQSSTLWFYNTNWVQIATITLNATSPATDGVNVQSSWRYFRANVTAITGTGASLQILLGN